MAGRRQIFPKLYLLWWPGYCRYMECSFCGATNKGTDPPSRWAEAYSTHGRHVATLRKNCADGLTAGPFPHRADFTRYIQQVVAAEISFRQKLKAALDSLDKEIPEQPLLVKNAPWLPSTYRPRKKRP